MGLIGKYIDFVDSNKLKWQQVMPGLYYKALSRDAGGVTNHLFLIKKGLKSEGPECHRASEDMYIVSGKLKLAHGRLKDKKGNPKENIFKEGCCVSNPGGVLHGPWEALTDVLIYTNLYVPSRPKFSNKVFVNPPVWECPKCREKIMWQIKTCTYCNATRPKNAVKFKPIKEAPTIISPTSYW